jgi:hypothetical protein
MTVLIIIDRCQGRIYRGGAGGCSPHLVVSNTPPRHHPKNLLDHTCSAFRIAISGTSTVVKHKTVEVQKSKIVFSFILLLARVDFLKRFN